MSISSGIKIINGYNNKSCQLAVFCIFAIMNSQRYFLILILLSFYCTNSVAQNMTEQEYNKWSVWWKTVRPCKNPKETDSNLVFLMGCDSATKIARAYLKKHQYIYLMPTQFGYSTEAIIWGWILLKQYNIIPVEWGVSCLRSYDDMDDLVTTKCFNKVIENYFFYRYGQKMEDVRFEKVDSVLNNTPKNTLKKWFPMGMNGSY